MGLDMYLKAKRSVDKNSAEAAAIADAAGTSIEALNKLAKNDPDTDETYEYIGRWRHNAGSAEHARATAMLAASGLAPFTTEESGGTTIGVSGDRLVVTADAVYWRKANAIHGWFVEKCQGGIDECQDTPVSIDQLKELRSQCQSALDAGTEDASDILPPREGFFFGSSDVDEYYFEDLRNTVSEISRILALAEKTSGIEFEYRSSW